MGSETVQVIFDNNLIWVLVRRSKNDFFVVAEQTEQQLSTVCKQVLVTWENCQLK